MTLTQRLAADLRARIASGELPAGDRLPAMRELASAHDVSDITVRGALRALKNEGLITMRPRVGAIVCAQQSGSEAAGKSLSGEKTVALLLPSLGDPFFARIAQGAERECARQGLRLLLVTTGGNLEKETRELEALGKQVAGLMIFPVNGEENAPYLRLMEQKVPVIFLDRGVDGVAAPVVGVDNERAGYLAAMHLLRLERPVWILSNPIGNIAPVDDRLRGFRRALAECGLPFEPSRVLQAHNTDEMIGAITTRRLLSGLQAAKPFSVFTMNDAIARGCYAALREANVSIPAHAAVVGFGDAWGPLLDPPLSAVWLGEENWGGQAVALLSAAFRGEVAAPTLIQPHFVTRGSCGADENFCRVTALMESAHTNYFQMANSRLTPVTA